MQDGRFPCEMVDGVPVVAAPEEIDITNAPELRSALLECGRGLRGIARPLTSSGRPPGSSLTRPNAPGAVCKPVDGAAQSVLKRDHRAPAQAALGQGGVRSPYGRVVHWPCDEFDRR